MNHFLCESCHYEVSAPDDEETIGHYMLCPACYSRIRIPPPVTNEKIEMAEALDQIYALHSDDSTEEPHDDYQHNIPVYCQVCHTLMYAAPERLGSYLTCPDCGTKTQVRLIRTSI